MKNNKKADSGILSRIRNSKWAKRLTAAFIGAIGIGPIAAEANVAQPAPAINITDALLLTPYTPINTSGGINTILTAPHLQTLMDRAYARGASEADILALQKAVFTEAESSEWDSDLGSRTRGRAATTMARLQRGEIILLTPVQSGQPDIPTFLTSPTLTGMTLTDRVAEALGTEEGPSPADIRSLQQEVGLPETGRATASLGERLRDAIARENGTTADEAALNMMERFIEIRGPERMSSQFGPRRRPLPGASNPHPAIDVAAPLGTPVVLNDDCTITGTSRSTATLRCVNGDEAIGMRGLHFSRVTARPGDAAAGTEIARIGNVGVSTGPHLHWTPTNTMGEMIDPATYQLTGNMTASERIAAMLMQGRGSNDAGFDAFADMSREARLSFNQTAPRVELAGLMGSFGPTTPISTLFGSPYRVSYSPTGAFGYASFFNQTVPQRNVSFTGLNNGEAPGAPAPGERPDTTNATFFDRRFGWRS